MTEHFVGGRGDKELWGQKLGAETHEQATAKALGEVMKGQARAESLEQEKDDGENVQGLMIARMCLWEQSDPQPGQTNEGQDEWQHHHLKLKEERAEVFLLFVF